MEVATLIQAYAGLAATAGDHAFAALITIGFPIYAFIAYLALRGRRAALVGDQPRDVLIDARFEAEQRLGSYRATAIWLLFIAIVALALWLANGRPIAALGLRPSFGAPVDFSVAVLAGFAAIQLFRIISVAMHPKNDAKILEQIKDFAPMLPRDAAELRLAYLLSFVAGVTEEIVYRGYMIWYFALYIPVPAAVLAAAAAFTLAHAYEGPKAMGKIALVAIALSAVYIATGSLLIPIIVHILIDLGSFTLAFVVLRRQARSQSGADG